MNSTQIMQAANPIGDTAFAGSSSDAEATAAFERIVVSGRTATAVQLPSRRRTRRRFAIALAAGAAAAAVVVVPMAEHGSSPSAWAVTTNADGTVTVKISDFRDPAGLQARLRQAGVRADVTTVRSGCLPAEAIGAKVAAVRVVPATFPAPFTWWKVLLGPDGKTVVRPGDLLPGQLDLQEVTLGTESQVNLTIAPKQLPPGDTIVVGFPVNHGGDSMSLQVDRTGAGPYCFPVKQN